MIKSWCFFQCCTLDTVATWTKFFIDIRELFNDFHIYCPIKILSLPESVMETFSKVVLTFESVSEILRCYHSDETSLAVLSQMTIYIKKFLVIKWNLGFVLNSHFGHSWQWKGWTNNWTNCRAEFQVPAHHCALSKLCASGNSMVHGTINNYNNTHLLSNSSFN